MLILATHMLAVITGAFLAFLWFLGTEKKETEYLRKLAEEAQIDAMKTGAQRWKEKHTAKPSQ